MMRLRDKVRPEVGRFLRPALASAVMLSAAKHLAVPREQGAPQGEILRCAQNDRHSGWACRLRSGLVRLHRDERGYTMLEYVMVFAFISVPIMLLFWRLFALIADYFSIIAFYVTWPFL
jgi:Flp pilus assembly pilin Flp